MMKKLKLNGSMKTYTEKAMAPYSSTIAWKISWTEEPGGLQSMGLLRVGHDWATSLSLFAFMHWRRKWQPTPVFLPWESQGQGSLVWLLSMGSHRVGHDWINLAAAAAAWRPKRPFRANTPERCPFHYRGLECKSRMSRNTWSNRQIWPWTWKEAGPRLIEFCQENAVVIANPLPTTQEKTLYMDTTRWSTPKSDWLYSLQPNMEKLYTVSKNKTGSWLWLRSWTPYCQIQT